MLLTAHWRTLTATGLLRVLDAEADVFCQALVQGAAGFTQAFVPRRA